MPAPPKIPSAPKVPKVPGPARFPWLGNKQMEPRMPGSGKAKRMKQLETGGYSGGAKSIAKALNFGGK